MQFQDSIPIYAQTKKYLCRQIALGKIKSGEEVPSVRQLAVDLIVNANTVQRAFNQMSTESTLEARGGLGSFVTTDAELILQKRRELIKDAISEFLESTAQLGLIPEKALEGLKKFIEEKKRD